MKYYEALEDLAYAYKTGELDQTTPLLVDNDATFVYVEEEDEVVFDGGLPRDLLEEALNLLGIPNDGV